MPNSVWPPTVLVLASGPIAAYPRLRAWRRLLGPEARLFALLGTRLGLRQLGQCGRLGLAHQRLGRQRNGQLDPQGVCIRLSSRAAVAHHAKGKLG